MSSNQEDLLSGLEVECDACHGDGEDVIRCVGSCEFCNGHGVVLTEKGKSLLDLISRHRERFMPEVDS